MWWCDSVVVIAGNLAAWPIKQPVGRTSDNAGLLSSCRFTASRPPTDGMLADFYFLSDRATCVMEVMMSD